MKTRIKRIHEHRVSGKLLGRHINHDPRSRAYAYAPVRGAYVSTKHVRHIPVLDQGSLGSCHDTETEVLTKRGWVKFAECPADALLATVDPSTSEITYERPTHLVAIPFEGSLIRCHQKFLDFAVTPDHKMLVRKWDERRRALADSFEFVDAGNLGWLSGLLTRVRWNGDAESTETFVFSGVEHRHKPQREDAAMPMAIWLRFLGIYLAEETMLRDPSNRDPHRIQLAGSKDRERTFIAETLAALGLLRSYNPSDRFAFSNKRVYAAMTELGLLSVKAPDKFVPDFVFDQPAHMIREFLEGHFQGDGCESGGSRAHYTSSKRLADDLQRLIFLSGDESYISVREPRTATMKDGRTVVGRYPEYRVSVCSQRNSNIDRAEHVTCEPYSGMVYCAEVPTYHTLVTRRKGRILISGNCTGNACEGAIGTSGLFDALPKALRPSKTDAVANEVAAVALYSRATQLDGFPGAYPPSDTGSDGLSVAKAAKEKGLISGYLHAFSLEAALKALQGQPIIIGIDWYSGFDKPDAKGLISISGKIRGGHEIVLDEIDAKHELVWLTNSWGTNWGQGGRACMSFKTLGKLLAHNGDATILLPLTQAPPQPKR